MDVIDNYSHNFLTALKKITEKFSVIILDLEHRRLDIPSDPFFSATFGSDVFIVNEKIDIMKTYLETCQALGDYEQLISLHK